MKELPYFRFTVQEWQNGNIQLESHELKGLFIDVCGFYWIRNCAVTKETLSKWLSKCHSDAKAMLQTMLDIGAIKLDEQNDFICIDFLDDQYDQLSKKQRKLRIAGRLGGIAKAKANAKQKFSKSSGYKDKDKDKEKDKDNILPKKQKHPFEKSPIYDLDKFKARFPDWSDEKLTHWHDQAETYSGANGGRYLDWGLAIQSWERKTPFKQRKSFDEIRAEMGYK